MKIHGKGKNGRPDMVYPQDFCAEPRRKLSKGERKAWQSLMGRLQSSVVLLEADVWRIAVKLDPKKQLSVPHAFDYAIADELGYHRLTRADVLADAIEAAAIVAGTAGAGESQCHDRPVRETEGEGEPEREHRKKLVELVWDNHQKEVEPRIFPTPEAARRDLESYCPGCCATFLKGDDCQPGDQCPNCHGLFQLESYELPQ